MKQMQFSSFLQQLLLLKALTTSDHLTKHSHNRPKEKEGQKKAHREHPGRRWDSFQIAPANKTTER